MNTNSTSTISDASENRAEYFRVPGSRGISSLTICYAGRESCQANHHFGPATRAQYLLHFIVKGKGRFHVNQHTYDLSENQVFLIQPNVSTYYIADAEDPWEYIWIGFDGQDVRSILNNCGLLGKYPYANYCPEDRIFQSLNSIVDGMRDQCTNDYELLGHLFTVFSCLVSSRQQEESPQVGNYYLKHAAIYIRNNYYKDINVQNIADFIGINRTYLYRLFVREFQTSPKQYILNYRLRAATDLLLNTDMTVSAIALACGFKDASTFCSHFKKSSGFTPSQYRNVDGEKQMTWKLPEI